MEEKIQELKAEKIAAVEERANKKVFDAVFLSDGNLYVHPFN